MKSGGVWAPIVFVACVASIAGWGPARRAEQALGPLLSIGEALFAPLAPETAAASVSPDDQRHATLAWSAYVAAVRGEGDVALPGRHVSLASVLDVELTERRRRITIAVPEEGVPDGALVTHRGAFVGLVVESKGGRASVALIGDDGLRPVAAEWQTAPTARPVHFLLDSDKGDALVNSRSSSVAPPEGQVAWTRAVSSLGDDLPPGLLLGRVTQTVNTDLPGGASESFGVAQDLHIAPLMEPEDLGIVTVETLPAAEREPHTVTAERVMTSGRAHEVRLDVGSRRGVEAGAWVVSDGVWLGRVDVAGWGSSLVERGVPRGTLLVLESSGDVVPCRTAAESWPKGWTPAIGDRVVTGHARLGGLLVGTVSDVDAQGFTIDPAIWPTDRHVSVVER